MGRWPWLAAAVLVAVCCSVSCSFGDQGYSLAQRWGYHPPDGSRVVKDESSPSAFAGDGVRLQLIEISVSEDELVDSLEMVGELRPIATCDELERVLSEVSAEAGSLPNCADLLGAPAVHVTRELDQAWLIKLAGQVLLLEERI